MSRNRVTDLDAALDGLARVERASRPAVSADLRARVLADAAEVSAEIASRRRKAAPARRASGGGAGLLGWLRRVDPWTGAAVAGALLCLAIGLGIGYGAGDAVLAGTGLAEPVQVARADEADAVFLAEDVL